MKTEIKEINSFTRELNISVGWKLIEKDFKAEFNKSKSNFKIPGFRKGKVPESIFRKQVGSSIEINFAEKSINDYYRKALESLSLHPINQATINKLDFKEGADLTFTAIFEITPEIKLPKYNNFKINGIRYMAQDDDVAKALKDLQERSAKVKVVDSGAKTSHYILADFQELDVKNLSKINKKLEKQYIRIGKEPFTAENEKKLIGSKEGDKIIIDIKNTDNKEIKKYKLNILKVEEQILPKIDDDFAKSFKKDIASVDELKNYLKSNIQNSLDRDYEKDIQNQIKEYFIKKTKMESPSSMVANFLSHIKEDLKKQNQAMEDDEFNKKYEDIGRNNVKWYLIKQSLIDKEKIELEENDLDNHIKELTSNNKSQKDQIIKFYENSNNKNKLYDELLNEKFFKKMKNYAIIKVVEKSTMELINKSKERK